MGLTVRSAMRFSRYVKNWIPVLRGKCGALSAVLSVNISLLMSDPGKCRCFAAVHRSTPQCNALMRWKEHIMSKKKESKKVVSLKKLIKARKAKIDKHESKLKKLKKKLKKAA